MKLASPKTCSRVRHTADPSAAATDSITRVGGSHNSPLPSAAMIEVCLQSLGNLSHHLASLTDTFSLEGNNFPAVTLLLSTQAGYVKNNLRPITTYYKDTKSSVLCN